MKFHLVLILLFVLVKPTFSQTVTPFFDTTFSNHYLTTLKTEYGQHKLVAAPFEKQCLIALSFYPELKDIRIVFKVKKAFIPLSARPTTWSLLFLPAKKRSYQVIISKQTTDKLEPILLQNLSFNAQIGVLGHELAHTSYYTKKTGIAIIGIAIRYFSGSFRNRFEFENDRRTIDHGLGYQLLAWSSDVRKAMKTSNWQGAAKADDGQTEGYMNPNTIEKIIRTHTLYKNE